MSEQRRTLGEALRALPPPPPPADGWPRLRESLQPAAHTPHRRWLMAAVVAAAAVLVSLRGSPPAEPPSGQEQPAAVAALPDLPSLQAESAHWEQRLAGLGAAVDSPASALLQATLSDRIALIDLLLDQSESEAARQALWGERVLLLRELYLLRSTPPAQLAGLWSDRPQRGVAL